MNKRDKQRIATNLLIADLNVEEVIEFCVEIWAEAAGVSRVIYTIGGNSSVKHAIREKSDLQAAARLVHRHWRI